MANNDEVEQAKQKTKGEQELQKLMEEFNKMQGDSGKQPQEEKIPSPEGEIKNKYKQAIKEAKTQSSLNNILEQLQTDSRVSGDAKQEIEQQIQTQKQLQDEQEERTKQSIVVEAAHAKAEEEAQQAKKEFQQNQAREQELKKLVSEYNSFKEDFHKELEAEKELRQKAIKGTLTAEEKNKLLGVYSSPEEEDKANKLKQEMDRRWKLVYEIKDKAEEAIEHRNKQIAEIDHKLKNPSLAPDEREKLTAARKVHEQTKREHEGKLDVIKKDINKREVERAEIKEVIKEGNIDAAKKMVKEHFKRHRSDYQKELQKNPNDQGLKELQELIKTTGLEEELRIGKADPKAQSKSGQSQNVATATLKPKQPASNSAAVANAKSAEASKTNSQSPNEWAEQYDKDNSFKAKVQKIVKRMKAGFGFSSSKQTGTNLGPSPTPTIGGSQHQR